MSVRGVDPARSRILLVGTSTYADPLLPDVPVVANNIADLAAVFTDPQLGGFDSKHCIAAPSGADIAIIGGLLTEAAEQAEDLLLFYYCGHGLVGRQGELFLGLKGSQKNAPRFTALAYDAVREACLDSRAASRVVILDSCFSGRAIGETLAGEDAAVAEQLEVSGTYTLASAPANRPALVLPGERHTAFTERLLDLLLAGSPQCGSMLSMGDIYRHLCRQLRGEGLPLPQQRGTATADLLGVVRNRQPGMAADSGVPEIVPDNALTQAQPLSLAALPSEASLLSGEQLAAVRLDVSAFERRNSTAEAAVKLAGMKPNDAALRFQRLSSTRATAIIEAMPTAAGAGTLIALDANAATKILTQVSTAKAAELLEHVKPIHASGLLTRLEPARAGALLARMDVTLLLAAVRSMVPDQAAAALHHVPPDVAAHAIEGMSPDRIGSILDRLPASLARKILVRLSDDMIKAVAKVTDPQRYATVRDAVDPAERVFDLDRADRLRPWAFTAGLCCWVLTAATVVVAIAAVVGWIPWEWLLLAIPEGLLATICITMCRMPVDQIAYPILGIVGYGGATASLGLIPSGVHASLIVGAAFGLLFVTYFITALGFKSEEDLAKLLPRVLP